MEGTLMKTSDIKLNEDGTLSISSCTLSTQELDETLLQLAQIRLKMNPQIPLDCPDAPLTVPGGARIGIGSLLTDEGFVMLALRHPGFGWLAYELLPRDASTIASHIIELVGTNAALNPQPGVGRAN